MLDGIRRSVLAVLGAHTEYRYTILKWQPSLRNNRVIPVALIAEKNLGEWGVRFVFGRKPNPEEAPSELSRRLIEQLPAWLREQMQEADQSDQEPLSYLSGNNPYNLFFTTPQTEKTQSDFFEEVLRLFGREILGEENPDPGEVWDYLRPDREDESTNQFWQPTPDQPRRRGRALV